MASLHLIKYKHGSGYIIRYRLDGKNHAEYLPQGTGRLQAQSKLAEFNKRLIDLKLEGKPFFSPLKSRDTCSIVDFWEWFRENKKIAIRRGRPVDPHTMDLYEFAFKKLIEVLGNVSLMAIPKQIKEIETMLSSYRPNSASMIVRALRAAWQFGMARGRVYGNPFLLIPVTSEHRDIGFWTVEEKDRIFQAIKNDHARKGFLLARYAGLRKIEICRNVQWEGLYWDSNYGIIPQAKTGEDQKFILHPILHENLRPLASKGFICPLHGATLSREISRARLDAGIQKPGAVRMLRHSLAHELLSQGYNIRIIQMVLRHSSISTTQIYTNFDTDEIFSFFQKAKL